VPEDAIRSVIFSVTIKFFGCILRPFKSCRSQEGVMEQITWTKVERGILKSNTGKPRQDHKDDA
jgi:hypothetical protein